MRKKFLKKYTGITILSATYLACLYAFLNAYFSSSKSTLVTINSYNEANIELILLLVTFPIVCKYLYSQVKETLGTWK